MQTKQIIIEKAKFTPEVTKNNPNIVYLPGFSLSAKSKAAMHLGNYLAKNGFSTLAISTTPRIISSQSLSEEASAVIKTIQETIGNTPFILVAHSKGASKAIAVLEQLQQMPLAAVLITPVGIYSQDPESLRKLFIKEVKENSLPNIKKELAKKQKLMTNLALSVLSMAANEAKVFFKNYPKRLQLETEELSIQAPQRAKKVLSSLDIPIVIGYTESDRVVETEKLLETMNQIKKQKKKQNIFIEKLAEPVTHGLPYTHPDLVKDLIFSAISHITSN